LVPEDGARTLSPQPALYWYVSPDRPAPFSITFFLRESPEQSARTLFRSTANLTDGGLYRMVLKDPVPPLAAGQVQRWQVRWQSGNRASQFDVNGLIRYEPNPEVERLANASRTNLDRARVLVKNGYWYDALDAYTLWLTENPKDIVARGERDELIRQGFSDHSRIKSEELPLLLQALQGAVRTMPAAQR
jgi:acylphosphatase